MSITRSSSVRHGVAALFVMLLAAPIHAAWAGATGQAPLPTDAGIEMALPMPVRDAPASKVANAVRTVGPHANCDFSDLQYAIDAAGQGDVLRIARSDAYLGKTYGIFGKSLTLRGGFDTCDPGESPTGHTTLDADGASARVIDIWENNPPPDTMLVNLENLIVRRGDGGILVEGQLGRLGVGLVNTQVLENTAPQDSGGGIKVLLTKTGVHNGTNNPLLIVDNDSVIANNHSGLNGGGVFCGQTEAHDYSRASILIGAASITGNSATNGGGIAISRCHRAHVYASAPIESGIPTGGIHMNTASDSGGGIYAGNGSLLFVSGTRFRVNYGSVYRYLGNADHAALVMSNTAAQGGGIVAEHSGTEVQTSGALVSGNSASGDGGAYLARNNAHLFVNPYSWGPPCSPEHVARDSNPMPPCGLVRDNQAGGHGGALRVLNGGYARFLRTYVENNSAGQQGSAVAVNLTGAGSNARSTAWIVDSLLTGNTGQTVGYAGNDSRLDFTSTTIAGNIALAAAVRVYAPGGVTSRVRFLSSIVGNNLTNVIVTHGTSGGTTQAVARCMIGPQGPGASNLTEVSHYRNVNPGFIDAAGGDYRLGPTSPAIDFCDDADIFMNKEDLAGTRRGAVWIGPPHGSNPALGPYDLGAYVAEPFFDIFANGFE